MLRLFVKSERAVVCYRPSIELNYEDLKASSSGDLDILVLKGKILLLFKFLKYELLESRVIVGIEFISSLFNIFYI